MTSNLFLHRKLWEKELNNSKISSLVCSGTLYTFKDAKTDSAVGIQWPSGEIKRVYTYYPHGRLGRLDLPLLTQRGRFLILPLALWLYVNVFSALW